jgi:hypothetical protein
MSMVGFRFEVGHWVGFEFWVRVSVGVSCGGVSDMVLAFAMAFVLAL